MQTKKEHIKDLLVDAATREFVKYGYAQSSLRRIVKSINVSTGTFYTYFKDKDDIFEFIVSPWTKVFDQLIYNSSNDPVLIEFYKTQDAQIIYRNYANLLEEMLNNKVPAYIYLLRSEGSKYHNQAQKDIDKSVDSIYDIFSKEIFIYEDNNFIDKFFLKNFYNYFLHFMINVLQNNIPLEEAKYKLKDMVTFMSEGWIGLQESKALLKKVN